MSILVECAEFDPKCAGCQAAKRALEGYGELVITYKSKLKETEWNLLNAVMDKESPGYKVKELESHLAVMVEAMREILIIKNKDGNHRADLYEVGRIAKEALYTPPIHHFIKLSEARQKAIEAAKDIKVTLPMTDDQAKLFKTLNELGELEALSEIEGKK